MRVLCINSKPIRCWNGETQYGGGLKEGEIYTACDIVEQVCGKCYIIEEIDVTQWGNMKLCIRFEKLDDDFADKLLQSMKIEEEELELV